MSKVRPMIDKDLRDEIVNYCDDGESFNVALRYFVKDKASTENLANTRGVIVMRHEYTINKLQALVNRRETQIIELKQEIAKLHNEKSHEKEWVNEVASKARELSEKASKVVYHARQITLIVLFAGILIGLAIGSVIGHLFL